MNDTARIDKWLWAARIYKTRSIAADACKNNRVSIGGVAVKPSLNDVYKNVTDPKQYEILEMSRISGFVDRARGTGRPTKKDRRALEAFIEPAMFGFYDDDYDDGNDE